MFFVLSPSDHNLGGTTLPGVEVGCRCNEGSCTKLPISICHPGDGGPRRRALPASSWLLHSAPASGRNIFMIFDISHLKTLFTLHVYFPSLKCLICCQTLSFRLNGIGASEVESWSKCLAVTKLGFDCWFCPPSVCWFAFVYILTSVLSCQAHLSF